MDFFGIGTAMRGMIGVYIQFARRTGRTTMLLQSLRPGDRVICAEVKQRQYLEQKLQDWGIEGVEVVHIPVQMPNDLFRLGTSKGQTIFDHSWVEKFYEQAINDAAKAIDQWQESTSGFGRAHVETRLQAEAIRKWRGTL